MISDELYFSLTSKLSRRAVLEALRSEGLLKEDESRLDFGLGEGVVLLQQEATPKRLNLQLGKSGNQLVLVDLDSTETRSVYLGDDTRIQKIEISSKCIQCDGCFLVTP